MDPRRDITETVLGWASRPPSSIGDDAAAWSSEGWEAARWAVQVHGIAPLLHRRLAASESRGLPEPFREYLAEQHALNGQRIAEMMAELEGLLWTASGAGLTVMPLKGGALLYHYYDEPGLRPMADLDVLVSPREAPAMGQILTGLGYCLNAGDTSRRHSSYYLARLGLRPVYRAGEHPLNPHLVEVHTAVAEERLGISYAMTEDMWAGARPARFGGAEGYLPTPPSLLQHLLIHNCADMMAHKLRLVRLYDVSLVAKRLQETEWADLIAAAQERREERFLYAPLQLTERYFPGSVPPAVIARLEAGSPGSLRQMLRMATAYDLSLCNPKAISFREALCWQRVGRERLRAFARMVLPSPEEMRVKYPQVPAGTSMARYRLLHLVETAKWRGRRLLGLPGRAWVYRDRGGRPGAAPGP